MDAEPVTQEQTRIGFEAYRDSGNGSDHAARLRVGDCFAYALATTSGRPLLFKGSDYLHTHVVPATERSTQ
jgi:ribonuclease VapC